MKFTLKDYQADAVDDVLSNLKRAREMFKNPGKSEISSFSLSATTGAGKTVMAAAAIEALFWGSETFNFNADPGAVVIWFSDDPSLNKQTFNRLRQASEKFTYSNLVHIEPPFAKPRLEPGKVYFLNTQKLTKSSLLTRGHDESPEESANRPGLPGIAAPDMQGWTIWETLANTVAVDDLTLYLVLDEAHRGFNTRTTSDKPTIVRKLVNGTKARPPIPIVWGISATIDHFETAMQESEATRNRRALPSVAVDPSRVQESGLVKDTLVLDIPNEAGNFDSVLVRRAARKLKDSTERWAEYARTQGLLEAVQPLLVLQTPNTPNPDDVGIALDTIFSEYPELQASSVRHVLGDHTTQKFGSWDVDWIEPQLVEDDHQVRVLVAKDAISTGWDCPRAEVLVSFRPAKDNTHITQLLGRMVRNPLARRIPGDERLNAVDCILPFFDRTTASRIVRFLTGDLDAIPGGEKKAVLDGKELRSNPKILETVWQVWESLPTQTLPQRGARPVKRLIALAQALSADGVSPGALRQVEKELHTILDAYATRFKDKLDTAIREVWAVHIQQIEGQFGKTGLTYSEFIERADDRAIRTGFEAAKKAFGADVAQSYVDHLAGPDDESSDDDSLREAYVRAAALATVKEVRDKVDKESLELTERLFAQHRVAIKGLPDVRQQEYEDIRAMATEPQEGVLRPPRTRIEGYSYEDENGQIAMAPLAPLHLMSDENGDFPLTSLNSWEREVVLAELKRPNVRGWYRNPSRAAVDSLGIAYRDDSSGNWRSMHPDFVFFHEVGGKVVASIIDPHGHHLDDAAMKLKALARFSETYGEAFHRIEALDKIDGQMKVIDMTSDVVRDSVLNSQESALAIYQSNISVSYDILK
ncbi:MAG: type III restriction endonuclease subunit R [Elusimicrobia bacterium CG1_02_63_36]|nr:MAG: type III restriction endonuclease subunit R [Elusimicrobia bacterium CG1_02_63_36]PIP81420.1 MAG: type III restriction endonuclease subunit R [Elusimicrobia bacterium CG22_combo_CG10-13_8_21_14_all_63_91]PJA14943.1 MAG: type III restriction endonuclease subunit R [Elusimicrobia bacterium CG_4_10_14_0_2_um_filter_63_34]PJB24540.1 MAG: type III restriction endonuclease subunit R [Elusimicrobia bacterium CG_4_9_14_3_um_filter_62_55]